MKQTRTSSAVQTVFWESIWLGRDSSSHSPVSHLPSSDPCFEHQENTAPSFNMTFSKIHVSWDSLTLEEDLDWRSQFPLWLWHWEGADTSVQLAAMFQFFSEIKMLSGSQTYRLGDWLLTWVRGNSLIPPSLALLPRPWPSTQIIRLFSLRFSHFKFS